MAFQTNATIFKGKAEEEPANERPFKRRKVGASASFSNLPDEILMIICGHLDIISRVRLRRVSRKWNFILRGSAVRQTVTITEAEHRYWAYHCYGFKLCFMDHLRKSNVFKHVKHLVLEGDYDLTDQRPNGGDHPYSSAELFPATIDIICRSRRQRSIDFEELETITVRKIAAEVDVFRVLTGRDALKCRLTVENGSLVIKDYDADKMWSMECEIPQSKTFSLSGRTACLDLMSISVEEREEESDDDVSDYEDDDEDERIPLEIAQFVVDRFSAVAAHDVARLGSVYSELLKGREGMVIRQELDTLFGILMAIGEHDKYDRKRKHWEQCKSYNFNSVGNWLKYALVYYAKPRNCYALDTPSRASWNREL